MNDRIPEADVVEGDFSLVLIRPDSLSVRVLAEGRAFNNTKKIVRAIFELAGSRYAIRVTDPVIEAEYCAKGEGTYDPGEAILCVSLAEAAYHGHCYKLVAAVITPARAEG